MLPWLKEKIVARKQRWLRPTRSDEIRKPSSSPCESQDETTKHLEELSAASSDLLQLKIVTSRMGIVNIQITQFDSGLQIIEKVIKKLEASYSPSSSFSDDIHCYKLVRSSTKKPFRDYDSLIDYRVKNNEEFLLLTKRTCEGVVENRLVQQCRGPNEREILVKTRNIPLIRSNSTSISSAISIDSAAFFQGDLQSDLRKILSEIAKYSAFVLATLPFGEKLINYYRQKILMSLYNHQDIVKLLMDMGFSRENVLRALRLQGNNYSLALDWLVENVNVMTTSTVTALQSNNNNISDELAMHRSGDEDIAEATYRKLYNRKTSPSTSSIFYPKHKAISIKEKVEGLLEIVRYYSDKNDDNSTELQDTINSLVNLGFRMDDIQKALRVNGQNSSHIAVCQYLLENCADDPSTKNALRETIFVETHILKILLNTPQIQMSLSSPKFFIAYCSMLENYSSLNIFFNDIESQSLLQHILRTYHEERIYFHSFQNSPVSSTSS